MTNPVRKKRRKRTKNNYFTKVHEEAIVEYALSSCIKQKTQLYASLIQPAFDEMVNKIILSSNKRIFINDIIIKLNKNFKFQKFNLSKKNPNKKFLGSNSLAKKFIKYQPEKDIFDAVDELNKKYKDHFK